MKKTEFTKKVTELVRATEEFEVTLRETDAYIKAITDVILDAMADGDEVLFPRIAKFSVADVPARKARNPRTGEPIDVPAKKKVKVKVLSDLKNSVL